MSLFDQLKPVRPTNIVKIVRKYFADNSDNKIDLASGEYRDGNGKPWVLPAVKLAEEEIHDEQPIIADYLFPQFYDFPKYSAKLVLGENSPAIKEDRICSVQVMSGTGALRLGAEFLASLLIKTVYYYSEPTWDNHLLVFDKAGFKEGRPYRYWCRIKHEVDIEGFLEDLNKAPQGAVIILHACAHNPTGIDLTNDQWKQIAVIMKERKLVPFFDSAFQGLAKDLDEDAWSVRYFVEQGFELFCAQSFSKNMGLYGERIGNLVVVTKSTNLKTVVESNIGPIHRAMYLIPGTHGNRIVTKVLSNPKLTQQWLKDLETMRNRITKSRRQLSENLERLETPGDWSFLRKQVGISTLILFDEKQVEHLANKHHVYLRGSGRLNFSAITEENIEYIAQAIHETLTSTTNKK